MKSSAIFLAKMMTSAACLSMFVVGCGVPDTHQPAAESTVLGFTISSGLETDHSWYESAPSASDISNFIASSAPNRDQSQVSNDALAQKILSVAQCFQLDPRIFAAMIRKESSFKIDAVSRTNAVGLTQMTGIAIAEANDQLGQNDGKNATPYAVKYFQDAAHSCGLSSFLWEDYDSVGDMKAILKSDADYALIYGAVVLKVFVTKEYPNSSDFDTIYRAALSRYNGEGKASYAKDIIAWADLI